MKILLTNDDGIEAPGLKALFEALRGEHECLVVAPASEKSAASHSISLGQKLVVEEKTHNHFVVHGTPADCVKFALSELKYFHPDLLIAGINPGPNTGVSVYYSGTISAAREGLINKVPSLAVSIGRKTATDFSFAAGFIASFLEGYKRTLFPQGILININIPALAATEIRGIRIARQAESRFIEEFVQENPPGRKRIYTLAGEIEVYDPDGTTDEEVLCDGFISITPLKLDLTDHSAIPILERWFKEREELWFNPKNI